MTTITTRHTYVEDLYHITHYVKLLQLNKVAERLTLILSQLSQYFAHNLPHSALKCLQIIDQTPLILSIVRYTIRA